MYGFGMPILFPLATLAIFVLSRVEEFKLYYFYKMPPMYDEIIVQRVLMFMRFAPVLYLACGYWMITN